MAVSALLLPVHALVYRYSSSTTGNATLGQSVYGDGRYGMGDESSPPTTIITAPPVPTTTTAPNPTSTTASPTTTTSATPTTPETTEATDQVPSPVPSTKLKQHSNARWLVNPIAALLDDNAIGLPKFITVTLGPVLKVAGFLWWPFVIALAVWLFLRFHNRIDGNDPKLHAVYERDDRVHFD